MLTTAVFAICITAPLGAIFINTLGTKWLNYDGPPDTWETEAPTTGNKDDEDEPGSQKINNFNLAISAVHPSVYLGEQAESKEQLA